MLLLAAPAAAQEFVFTHGTLSDENFYRAVACAAPPGGACHKPFLRWPQAREEAVSIALSSLPDDLSADRRMLYETGLEAAIAQVNALGARITLRRATDAPADIEIHVVDAVPGEVVTGTGVPDLDGAVLELGRVALRARDGEIGHAVIAVSASAPSREIASILLEEIVQGLGLMTDIAGPAYRRSLFSETGNSVTRLTGQDAMALRRHYARGAEDKEN
ncbi:DUF2927 domain-containing protein [Jannaschia seosinensis]|uniref:DUF2927 domain-containing protein n=1 Tax=Jannaschia seosinensis TaxID=313367 RepID=UPI0006E19988|nr:DUF2927 domain-containing protein [Jannaschia seosinensis]